ncbi:MerR family transcriptional regulator [Streptomyces silvensis]|uniref:Transcriptional regulator n=1 Tax=Streptomyces silvensis TaxID=1765722 RepID=A0A0W7X8A9_9ACTN|nr:transcriptional regulator [Streptomyces silvensis]
MEGDEGVGTGERPVTGAAPAGLATGAVARMLGVAPTTLRSWDRRYGIGPDRRAGTKHRRWGPQDIAVLKEMCRLTSSGVPPAEAARAASRAAPDITAGDGPPGDGVPPRGTSGGGWGPLPLGRVRQECRGLARAAVRLDAPTVDALLDSVLAAHGLVTAWDEVMMPALRAVGRKWETSGERYVEVEHLLSWHISSALRRIPAARRPSASGPPVLVAGVPGEMHTLPMEALTAGLTEDGVPVRMFGGAVPVEALQDAVRRAGPAVVVLWSQSRTTASVPLVRHLDAIDWGVPGARKSALVTVAGPGWAGARLPDGVAYPQSLGEALARVREFCAQASG